MTTHRSDRWLMLGVIGIAMLGMAGLTVDRLASRSAATHLIRDYVPPPAAPRIPFAGTPLPGTVLVRDFDVSGDHLVLLDAGSPQVIVLRNEGGSWRTVGAFGRRGGGPGEMVEPSGIAIAGSPPSIVVVDQNRLHRFDMAGRYQDTRVPVLPCMLLQTRVADADKGLLMSGRCMRGDTVMAELFHIAADERATAVAHDPIFLASDGVVLPATTLYSTTDRGGLFGGGTGACVFRIESAASTPQSTSVCKLGAGRYAFVADAQFKAKAAALAAARPHLAGTLTVPDRLPVYMERMAVGSAELLLRPISNDSLAFRRIGSDTDLAIAPVEGLIGCKAAGCLWVRRDTTDMMMFVSAARVAPLVAKQ